MNILLHTIALEPARWTPARVSRPLIELLPAIAAAGFYKLELFEPHVALAPSEEALADALQAAHLSPMVFSSYVDVNPARNPPETFEPQMETLLGRVARFGCSKIRFFPGRTPGVELSNEMADREAERLRTLASDHPHLEFLLETHDGSLADDPALVMSVIEQCGQPNVGLLWQPTIFAEKAARAQFAVQKSAIRHFHLQNRDKDTQFTTLADGVIPWPDFLQEINFGADVTIEFLTTGMRPVEEFDLTETLQEAVQEFDYVVNLES